MGRPPSTSTIKEMCELVVDCPHFTPDWTDSGYVVIRNQNIRNGRLDLTAPSFTHEADFSRRVHRARPRFGDIVITREAPMGEVCLVPADVACCLGQRQVLLRPKQSVDPRYLHIALQSPFVRHQILWSEGTGSTVSNIRIPVLDAIRIPRFGSAEPKIASTIAALDDKIELNRRMNETLEASARALFRDWFVDFGPTRAKAEGHPAYLAPDLWSLFPDRLDDGGVPEGWNVSTLAAVAKLNPETWGARDHPDAVSYVDLSSTKWGYIEKVEYFSWPDAPSRARRVLRPGDTIVGTVRPGNGSFAYVAEPDLTGSTGFAVLRPKDQRDRAVVWCVATSTDNVERLAHLADGGAYPAVRPETVLNTGMLIPSPDVLAAFGRLATPALERIEANKIESRALGATRDALLPKLMSGELRVRDAEALAA